MSGLKPQLLVFAVGLIVLMLCINGLNVGISYVSRDFMSAIEDRDMSGFVRYAWYTVAVYAASTVTAVIYTYCEQRLALLWRDGQTRRLLERYVNHRSFLHMEEEGVLANPDQRISEDVKSFTTTTLSFMLMTLNAVFTILAFSGVLWSISPELFIVAVAYALVGSLLIFYMGRPLIDFNVTLLDREADFRSELLQLRENAQSVTLMHREERVHQRLLRRFDRIVANTRRIISVNRRVGFFTNGYNWMVQLIPALIVAPLFIHGKAEFGVIAQSSIAFTHLMGAFSLIVTQFTSISSYAAVITRLGKLVDALDRAAESHSGVELVETGDTLRFDDLTLTRSDGRPLLTGLSLAIPRGCCTLITATSGSAKLALFSATAGLARNGSGRVLRPDGDSFLFVPDHPYMTRSSLREVLRTREDQPLPPDPELMAELASFGLERLAHDAGGLDVSRDWNRLASPGDQTRLILLRALLARPAYVFTDRLNALQDADGVRRIFAQLHAAGITYIALGQPEDRLDGYDAVLHLEDDGSWQWRSLTHSDASSTPSGAEPETDLVLASGQRKAQRLA